MAKDMPDPVLSLARKLKALWAENNRLDRESLVLDEKDALTEYQTFKTLFDRKAESKQEMRRVGNEIHETENAIASAQATTLAGAMVQIALAHSDAEITARHDPAYDGEDDAREYWFSRIQGSLYSAMSAIESEAGVTMRDLVGNVYMSDQHNPHLSGRA